MMDFILAIQSFSTGAFLGSCFMTMFFLIAEEKKYAIVLAAWGIINFMLIVIGLLHSGVS